MVGHPSFNIKPSINHYRNDVNTSDSKSMPVCIIEDGAYCTKVAVRGPDKQDLHQGRRCATFNERSHLYPLPYLQVYIAHGISLSRISRLKSEVSAPVFPLPRLEKHDSFVPPSS
jgi:hypothetical protein